MSDEEWMDRAVINFIEKRFKKLDFAGRVQMIHKLLKLIVETLDGMEAKVKAESP